MLYLFIIAAYAFLSFPADNVNAFFPTGKNKFIKYARRLCLYTAKI